MSDILEIIKDRSLTYSQKVYSLAMAAESSISPIKLSEEEEYFIDKKIICLMGEGNAPYRPRYITVDFEKFFRNGSEKLEIRPPTTIWEATSFLLILYKNIPSITGYPVYLGNVDSLLDPFIKDEKEAESAIKLFLMSIDKSIPDSFCHMNIGPEETKAGNIILKLTKELNLAVPNMTLKVSAKTPESFIGKALDCSLYTAKPSFANDEVFRADFKGGDYAIASCYNGLSIGGGSYTLVRVVLSKVADLCSSKEDFFRLIPEVVKNLVSIIGKRVKFIVEDSGFFESSFLAKEGLINKSNFTAMFGLVGLAECVNDLLLKSGKSERFGHSVDADELGLEIIERIDKEIKKYKVKYLDLFDGFPILHAQVGLSDDFGISPGCRIPVGEEPELFEHITQSAKYHKYFPSGIGDIFIFDQTYKKNVLALLDILKGSFSSGMRYTSFYSKDSDVVRVSGYLVKKSEIEKLKKHEAVLNGATFLGKGAEVAIKAFDKKIRV